MRTDSQTLLIAGGAFNLGMAVFHLFFWRIFHWKRDLARLTYVNRGIMQILNLCLTFLFFVMAYVSFFHTAELLSSSLGRSLVAAFAIFWLLRLVEQVFYFGIRNWISLLFTFLFLAGTLLYSLPLLWRPV